VKRRKRKRVCPRSASGTKEIKTPKGKESGGRKKKENSEFEQIAVPEYGMGEKKKLRAKRRKKRRGEKKKKKTQNEVPRKERRQRDQICFNRTSGKREDKGRPLSGKRGRETREYQKKSI